MLNPSPPEAFSTPRQEKPPQKGGPNSPRDNSLGNSGSKAHVPAGGEVKPPRPVGKGSQEEKPSAPKGKAGGESNTPATKRLSTAQTLVE